MIGVLGGTFDPIHFGHLRTALEIAEGCGMEQVRFIPGHIPPHRPQPSVSAQQRLDMVRLAITDEDYFIADSRELDRVGESYTVETLQSLRDDFGLMILALRCRWYLFWGWMPFYLSVVGTVGKILCN